MKSSQIVIARSYGQLGNRLFLYAHFIAAAQEYGVSLANPCFAEYASYFPATANDLWCRYPVVSQNDLPNIAAPSTRRRRWLSQAAYLSGRVLSISGLLKSRFQVVRLRGTDQFDLGSDDCRELLDSGRKLVADGWLFRSERLLDKHADVIRNHFRIQPESQRNVDQVIGKIRQTADVVIGVHIRHGDYATFLGGKYFYPVSQYAQTMRDIAAQFPAQRVAFLVCSNAKILPGDFDGLTVHHGPGHLIEDMYSFAKTDFLVGPPSTYTLWASFYGNVPLAVLEQSDQKINAGQLINQKQNAA